MPDKLSTASAVFKIEGHDDLEVRTAMDEQVGFSLIHGERNASFVFPKEISRLQVVEALQFVVDTIGNTLPDRMTPFARGWISTAAKATKPHDTLVTLETIRNILGSLQQVIQSNLENEPSMENQDISNLEIRIAKAIIYLMSISYTSGWAIPKAVETLIGETE